MINPYLKIRDALGGDLVFDDVPFLLASVSENEEMRN